jgi:hypothetical protein
LTGIVELLESMAMTIARELKLDYDEVMYWEWPQLKDTFLRIGRLQYDSQVSQIATMEAAVQRALAPMFGNKHVEPLKKYDEIDVTDPFAPKKQKDGYMSSGFLQKYLAANNLSQ